MRSLVPPSLSLALLRATRPDSCPFLPRSFPLHAPVIPEGTKPEDVAKPQPVLGHVSMLNTMTLIPADPAHGIPRDWIATGDRDEHVRISRFPAGHVIEKFGWGSKACVVPSRSLPLVPRSSDRA